MAHVDAGAADGRSLSKKHDFGKTERQQRISLLAAYLSQALVMVDMDGNPSEIFDQVQLNLSRNEGQQGAKDALRALRGYYEELPVPLEPPTPNCPGCQGTGNHSLDWGPNFEQRCMEGSTKKAL